MLKIRKSQMEALAKNTLDLFAMEMKVHVRQHFPAMCDNLGEEQIGEMIQYGISQAGRYGFEVHRDICRFIDLMFAFGRDFASDPAFPWAADVLNDPAITDPITRMEKLYTEARRTLT